MLLFWVYFIFSSNKSANERYKWSENRYSNPRTQGRTKWSEIQNGHTIEFRYIMYKMIKYIYDKIILRWHGYIAFLLLRFIIYKGLSTKDSIGILVIWVLHAMKHVSLWDYQILLEKPQRLFKMEIVDMPMRYIKVRHCFKITYFRMHS